MNKIPVDITFHPSWWHDRAGICFNRDFFYNADYRLEADVLMRKVLFEKFGDSGIGEKNPEPRPIVGSDLIASGYLHSEILGCEVRYSDENPPEVLCKNMTDEEAENLDVPNLDESLAWRRIESQLDYLYEKYGYVETSVNLMGIQNIALDLRGSELFIDYHANPELAHHLLEVCAKLSIAIGKRLKRFSDRLSAGVTAIVRQSVPDVYLTSNCSVEMVSLDIYKSFLLKYDNMLAEEFTTFGVHHCGQSMEHVVDGYKLVKNLKFAEVGAFSDLAYVRRQLPNIHLNARYSPVRIKDSTPDEMKADIEKIFEDGRPHELLSISCVGIDSGVSDEQIRRFLALCKGYTS